MTWLDDLTFSTVLVHTTDNGPSFKGVRAAVHDDCLVLRDVGVFEDDGSVTMLNGEIAVPREKVHYLQIIGAGQ